ncbi:MAG: pilus assembly protein PilM [Pseudonocardiales bacterium]
MRILLMGGTDITQAVSERLGVPMEEAESIKQHTGMAERAPGVLADSPPPVKVIESSGAAFVEEVRGSLDYYLAQAGSVEVKRIVLSGGGGQLRGLAGRLSLATRLPVESGSAMSGLKIGKVDLDAAQLALVSPVASVPVGLAMGVAS